MSIHHSWQRIICRSVLIFAAICFGTPGHLYGSVIIYTAGMGVGVPENASRAGFAKVTVDTDAHTMRVEVTFIVFSSTVTNAHIHAPTLAPILGTAGAATPLTGFPVGVRNGLFDSGILNLLSASTYDSNFLAANGGTASLAEIVLIASLNSHKAYIDVHTDSPESSVDRGEISGFLFSAVPEPSSFVLTTLIVFGLTLRYGRKCILD